MSFLQKALYHFLLFLNHSKTVDMVVHMTIFPFKIAENKMGTIS